MCCVRPGVFDANARRFCCVSVLIAVDLPALLRPTNAISGSSLTGSWSSWLAVVRKRAVWVQASARFASLLVPEAFAGWDAASALASIWSSVLVAMKSPKALIVKSPGFAQENAAPMKLAAPLLSCLLLAAMLATTGASFAADELKPAAKPDLAKG